MRVRAPTVTQPAPARTPEQLLWAAVLARVIKDAQGNCLPRECAAARVWLTRAPGRWRALICDFAGVEPSALERWARSLRPLLEVFPELRQEDVR